MMLTSLSLAIVLGAVIVEIVQTARGADPQSQGSLGGWFAALVLTAFVAMYALLGLWWSYPLLALCVCLLMPWTVTRRVLIPLGLSVPARYLSCASQFRWQSDRVGGGLVAGAWAVLRKRRYDARAAERIAELRDRAPRLTAAHVLATGLLTAARGDRDGARALLESVDELSAVSTPRAVHALAREWLVADAASRGEWARAAELARAGTDAHRWRPRSRATRLLGAVARRLTGAAPEVSTAGLWVLWALAPSRGRTFAMVRRAAAAGRERRDGGREDGARAPLRLGTSLRPDLHADALRAHLAVLSGVVQQPPAAGVEMLARAWDAALSDPELVARVAARAGELGAAPGRALGELEDAVARELAAMARAGGVAIPARLSESRTMCAAQRSLRDDLLSELELAFDALDDRLDGGRALPAIDEWREFLALRALHARVVALGGDDLRRLAFPHVHRVLCRLAVALWNVRQEHAIANAMFRWLLDEALAAGDAEAIELQSRNWDPAI